MTPLRLRPFVFVALAVAVYVFDVAAGNVRDDIAHWQDQIERNAGDVSYGRKRVRSSRTPFVRKRDSDEDNEARHTKRRKIDCRDRKERNRHRDDEDEERCYRGRKSDSDGSVSTLTDYWESKGKPEKNAKRRTRFEIPKKRLIDVPSGLDAKEYAAFVGANIGEDRKLPSQEKLDEVYQTFFTDDLTAERREAYEQLAAGGDKKAEYEGVRLYKSGKIIPFHEFERKIFLRAATVKKDQLYDRMGAISQNSPRESASLSPLGSVRKRKQKKHLDDAQFPHTAA